MAHRLIAHKGQAYPFGRGRCVVRGAPCCVFGQILLDASPTDPEFGGRKMFAELREPIVILTNTFALARVLGLEDQSHLPGHVVEALVSVSNANDNPGYGDGQRRSEVADRLFYAADVLAYADISVDVAAA
jgi:hypothetical protein